MRWYSCCGYVLISFAIILNCRKSDPQISRLEFDQEFFRTQVPELPNARLLKESDLPLHQQKYFEEFGAQLQLLVDLNQNGIPEYVVAGICDQYVDNKIKMPYFIAIFERQATGVSKLFFQRIYIPPVNIYLAEGQIPLSVVISFAFATDYGAEIYFANDGYHLEQW